MSLQKRFSSQDLERIKNAVKEAESKISGEIVPVFVEKSGFYTIANYRAGVMAAALVFVLIIIFDRYVPSLAVYDPLLIFTLILIGGLIGALAANFIDPVRRLMLGRLHMDQSTRKRAENAFLEQEVFNTSQRTGIMIFVSFFEREVIVMADKGISKVVEQKAWDKIVKGIIDHVHKDRIIDGMEGAIRQCGELLLEKGFSITPDDINELNDDLRIE